ncbi:MAG: hypothetical protein L6V91_03215 [Bacilli bacterium]|nr:MAG: hypothetical protein L6V91_03215 [Bacilli bacterium]
MLVSIIGTFITYFTAYATARIKGKIAKVIHILTISSLAIPGIVLGLSYTISFKDSFIYNTFYYNCNGKYCSFYGFTLFDGI